jgi:hypothetical protein
MIRIGFFLGSVLGLLETGFALGALQHWQGYVGAVTVAVLISALFGGLVGAGYRLLRRLTAGPSRRESTWQATVFITVALAMTALYVHGDGSWLPGVSDAGSVLWAIAVLITGHVAFIVILRLPRRAATSWLEMPGDSRFAQLAAFATVGLLAGLGLLAAREAQVPTPGGQLEQRAESSPWPRCDAMPDDLWDIFAGDRDPPLPAGSAGERAPRLILIGLDGVTWDIANTLLKAGQMPHLKSLLERGIGGSLRSTVPSSSPIVWTTIVTGKSQAQHGVDSWQHATADRRRCRALWSLLQDGGLRSLVVNVPGSYPADAIDGAFLAGFSSRAPARNNRGTVFTTRSPQQWNLPVRRLSRPRPEKAALGSLVLADRTDALPAEAFCVSRLLPPGWPSEAFAAALTRRFARLDFTATETELRFRGPIDRPYDFSLRVDDWSPWLELDDGFRELHFRLKLLELTPDAVSLYVTPLFLLAADEALKPPQRVGKLLNAPAPYVIEGADWTCFREPKLLSTLAEQTFGMAADRYRHVRRLWTGGSWDALIFVVTLTDCIQHPFWPFLPESLRARVGPSTPCPHAIDVQAGAPWRGGTIPLSYAWGDKILGEILTKATPQTVVAVVSHHGFGADGNPIAACTGAHESEGIYVFAGGPFRDGSFKGRRFSAGPSGGLPGRSDPAGGASDSIVSGTLKGEPLTLADVTPTIPAALGLPIAADFAGSVSPDLARFLSARGGISDTIATYER